MNLLTNLRIKVKAMILVGASVITAVLMFIVASLGLSQIKGKLDQLLDTTNVERYAYETILQEKNYLLNANAATGNRKLADQAFQSAEKDVATILQALDRIDIIADPETLKRSRAARAGTTAYADLYRKGVAALNELDALTNSLEKDGEAATQQARDYIRTIGNAEKVAIARDILEYTYLIRADEKRYMLYQRPETFGAMKSNFARMMERLSVLAGSVAGEREATQVAAFENAAKSYEQAAFRWVDRNNELYSHILPQMKQLGDEVIKLAFEAASKTSHDMVDARQRILLWLAVIGVAIAVSGIVLGLVVSGAITKPVGALTLTMTSLSQGQLDVAVPSTAQRDEIGVMARAVQVFKDAAIAQREMEAREREDIQRRQARQERVEQLTAQFDSAVSAVVVRLKDTVGTLHSNAQVMSGNAEDTSSRSQAVAAAAEQARANVQTVSAAGAQLSASIQEISRQVGESASIAQRCASEAAETNTKINRLVEAADRIGEIISLISDIASQTNLLALNATIEAARAGDAGKGFAVVAQEVKSLANQTARATEEISGQIAAIQQETSSTVADIRNITATISRVNELSTMVAGAVEEQGAATAEIARNVEQAATGIADVADNIAGVTAAAGETGSMAQGVFVSANDLQGETGTLSQSVETFLAGVRNA